VEVHHHPNVERKNLKEYFLEFLMIFLAVSMGFFAENLQEKIADNGKEKEYMQSLVQNLKDDTAAINATINENEMKLNNLKDIMAISFKNLADPATRKLLYKTCSYIGFYSVFKSNDATMQQLKNSGGLRLIRKKHVADSIAAYDNMVKIILAAEEFYDNSTNLAINAAHQLLDYSVYYDSTYFTNDSFTNKPLPLVTSDPEKIKLLFNSVDFEIGANQNYITNIKQRLPFIKRLIEYLKKEYHLQ
jgi:hypothetical protein